MSPQVLSILVLAVMFVIATVWPINMGMIAFVAAFLVGTLVGHLPTKTVIEGFPSDLFLTLVGITFMFALAQNNGTIEWLVQGAVRAVRGRLAAIPWIMFFISAVLTAVGAVSPGAVAIIAPIALGFAAKYGISPMLMGLMVVHGAQAGGFSPISIYGGITNGVVRKAGLPLEPVTTFLASLGANFVVAGLLFFVLGGRKLLQQKPAPAAVRTRGGGRPAAGELVHGRMALPGGGSLPVTTQVATPQAGAQVYGDAEGEALSEERAAARGGARDSVLDAHPAETPDAPAAARAYRVLTVAAILVLAVLTLALELHIGLVALTLGLLLVLCAPNLQKRALGQVPWPEVMLIAGVSTYVGVLQKMGTIDFVGKSVAGFSSPLVAALLLLFIGAIVSAFASSTAVLGSLIPLAVPFLQSGTGVGAVGFIAAMAVASTIVDVSPFSTNGALVLANAQGVNRDAFFRKLMGYGGLVTVVAPVVLWMLFVVLGG